MSFLQSLRAVDERLGGYLTAGLDLPVDETLLQRALTNVQSLCRQITKPIRKGEREFLDWDDDGHITSYIKKYRGSANEWDYYMLVANEFLSKIQSVYSTDYTISDLRKLQHNDRFEFIFTSPTRPRIFVYSQEYEHGGFKVYLNLSS